MKKKVIAFTLYKAPNTWEEENLTSFIKYFNGFKQNIDLIKTLYPDWWIYVYHNKDLDISKINIDYDKFEWKLVDNLDIAAMQWRFLPNDDEDVELFISRDIDSRITSREVQSVNEWIDSNKILHIMRDHPHHHYKILGGMWGMRSQKDFNMLESCVIYNKNHSYNSNTSWYEKWWDMNFLRDVIYDKYSHNSYINASYFRDEFWAKDFTIERVNSHFIGEIFDENNIRGEHYRQL